MNNSNFDFLNNDKVLDKLKTSNQKFNNLDFTPVSDHNFLTFTANLLKQNYRSREKTSSDLFINKDKFSYIKENSHYLSDSNSFIRDGESIFKKTEDKLCNRSLKSFNNADDDLSKNLQKNNSMHNLKYLNKKYTVDINNKVNNKTKISSQSCFKFKPIATSKQEEDDVNSFRILPSEENVAINTDPVYKESFKSKSISVKKIKPLSKHKFNLKINNKTNGLKSGFSKQKVNKTKLNATTNIKKQSLDSKNKTNPVKRNLSKLSESSFSKKGNKIGNLINATKTIPANFKYDNPFTNKMETNLVLLNEINNRETINSCASRLSSIRKANDVKFNNNKKLEDLEVESNLRVAANMDIIHGRNNVNKIEELVSGNFSSKDSNFVFGEVFDEKKLLASPLKNAKRRNEKVYFTTNQLSPTLNAKNSAPDKAMFNKYKHLFSDVNNLSAISNKIISENSMLTISKTPYKDLGLSTTNNIFDVKKSGAISNNYRKIFTSSESKIN